MIFHFFGDSFHILYYTCFNAILPNRPTLSVSYRVMIFLFVLIPLMYLFNGTIIFLLYDHIQINIAISLLMKVRLLLYIYFDLDLQFVSYFYQVAFFKINFKFFLLQIKTLSAIVFGNSLHVCMLSHFSHIRLIGTLWTVAHQLSVGFSRQEHWNGLLCHPPVGNSLYYLNFIHNL